MLIDTGSNVTITQKKKRDILPREHKPNIKPVNAQLLGITANKSPFKWKTIVILQIGKHKFDVFRTF